MKISIIVPVYNLEERIERCLLSLLCQTFYNIEIVVVDDGSTDNSFEIVMNLSASDNRIRFLRQNNMGLSAARNSGLRIISGNYVIFVDGDDWVDSRLCEYLAREIYRNKPDIVIYGLRFFYLEHRSDRPIYYNDSPMSGLDYFKKSVGSGRYTPTVCNKCFNVDLVSGINFPHGLMYEDIYFSLILFARASKITSCQGVSYYYDKTRDGSITREISCENISDIKKIYRSIVNDLSRTEYSEILSSKEYLKDKLERYTNELVMKLIDGSNVHAKKEFIDIVYNDTEYRGLVDEYFQYFGLSKHYLIAKLFLFSPIYFEKMKCFYRFFRRVTS